MKLLKSSIPILVALAITLTASAQQQTTTQKQQAPAPATTAGTKEAQAKTPSTPAQMKEQWHKQYNQWKPSIDKYMKQAKASDITIGGAYGIQIGEDKRQEVDFGLWHRVKDALIPYIGYQLAGFQFGLSYDYTVSKIKTAGQVRNGYELTLIYTGNNNTEERRLMPWY